MVNIITESSGKLIEISIIDSYLISATDDDDDSSAAIFLPLKSNFNAHLDQTHSKFDGKNQKV